jgi:hypothetical protein
MKKGFVFDDNPQLLSEVYDLVYYVGMEGKERNQFSLDRWKDENVFKRGIIHRPAIMKDTDEYANASSFKWLLDDLTYSGWNNGNPLIIDIFGVGGDNRFNLDHIRVYGSYITEHFKPKLKPLLRLNPATWNAFLKANKTEALRLLTNYNLIMVEWGVTKPSPIEQVGIVKWWEYKNGMIAYDETGEWLKSPVIVQPPVVQPPIVEPPIVQPPVVQPPVVVEPPVEEKKLKKYKISLLGGLISGTVEEIE